MNALDAVLAVVLLIGLIGGLARGFVRTLFGLAALVLAILAAASGYGYVADNLLGFLPGEGVPAVVSFVIIFVLVLVVVSLIGKLIAGALKLAALGWLDRLAGGLLGLILASVISSVLLLGAVLLGFHASSAAAGSSLAPVVLRVADGIVAVVPAEARERFQDAYEDLRGEWADVEEPRREGKPWERDDRDDDGDAAPPAEGAVDRTVDSEGATHA